MKPITARNILISLLLFLGIGTLGGGLLFIISPSGKFLDGLPLSILGHLPFSNFLIPRIILFLILGISPCLLTIALIKKPAYRLAEYFNFFKDMYWRWSYCIYIAFALIIWIQIETIMEQGVSWLQSFYILYAIPIIFVTLLPQVRTIYKK